MRRGASAAEVVVISLLVVGTVMALYMRIRAFDVSAKDQYRDWLASALAREPVEILGGADYYWLTTYADHPLPDFPLGWQDLPASPPSSLHPAAAAGFRRNLRLERVSPLAPGKPAAVRVVVTVQTNRDSDLPSAAVVAESLVIEGKP